MKRYINLSKYTYSGYVIDKITKRKLELKYDYSTTASSDAEAMRNIKYNMSHNSDEIVTGIDTYKKVDFCPECLYIRGITADIVTSQKEDEKSVADLTQIAKDIMKKEGRSTCCNIVAQKIEEESGMRDIDDFLLMSSDGTVNQQGNHHVNISQDRSTIYDFTGDQFNGGPYTSEPWIYNKVADGVYMSQNRYPFEDRAYINKYIRGLDSMTITMNFLSNPPDDLTMMIIV